MKTTALACLFVAATVASASAQDVLVVAPEEFQGPVGLWKMFREKQGMEVVVKAPTDDVGALVNATFEASRKKLRFVMLVGDVEKVPCALRPRQATSAVAGMEPDPNIASDAPFADVDGDGVPDLAIGRVPADTAQEAMQYLERVLIFESSHNFGAWRTKLNVVAGTGGFGPLVDMALENLTRSLLSSLPPAVDVSMTYASPFSPFCPPPAEFADYAVRRWNEGALVVAYVGHGSTRSVDTCHFGKENYPILGMDQVGRIMAEHPPISMFVACSTGHMDGPRDCLAEEMLKQVGGPIAVVASSRVSTPYSNGIVAKEMLDALYVVESPTVGEMLLAVKRRLLDAPAGDAMRDRLERLAAATYEKSPEKRRVDRADHVLLYNLLGDPCIRIARPSKIEVAAPAEIAPGTTITVKGRADFDGAAVVELIRRKDPPPKLPPGLRTNAEDYRTAYEAANFHGIAKVTVDVKKGEISVDIAVPADAPVGPCAVRIFVVGRAASAAGGVDLTIAAPSSGK